MVWVIGWRGEWVEGWLGGLRGGCVICDVTDGC